MRKAINRSDISCCPEQIYPSSNPYSPESLRTVNDETMVKNNTSRNSFLGTGHNELYNPNSNIDSACWLAPNHETLTLKATLALSQTEPYPWHKPQYVHLLLCTYSLVPAQTPIQKYRSKGGNIPTWYHIALVSS